MFEGSGSSSVVFEEVVDSRSAAFHAFYALYEAAFPLADEREPPEAFDTILQLNADQALQRTYGPYREVVALIRAWDGGPIIGGHIFGIVTSEEHRRAGLCASVQGIYTFLHPDARGALPIPRLVAYSRKVATSVFPSPELGASAVVPILFEVNNPVRMSADDIALDTQHSGTDPYRRFNFWLRCGFRPLEFEYLQPRLRSDAATIRYLDLFCTSAPFGTSFPARVLLRHLRAFVSISVLKGRDADDDVDFMAMKRWLDAHADVGFKSEHAPDRVAIAEYVRRGRRR